MTNKWDIRFMRLAREVSSWSKDPSTQIGAVIVDRNKRIVSTGYNGFPRNVADDDRLNNREEKYHLIIHGEMNALLSALNNGVSVKDCTIYIYGLPPCSDCTKAIIQSGIEAVVFCEIKETNWKETWKKISFPLLKEAQIIVEDINVKELD